MRIRIAIAAAIAVSAVFGLPWHPAAPNARAGGGSGHAALHILRLQPPPKAAYPRLRGWDRIAWDEYAPWGMDAAGDVLLYDGGYYVIRYSTTRHAWLPGIAITPDIYDAIVPTENRFIWVTSTASTTVFKSHFNRHNKHVGQQVGGMGRWANVGGLAPVANGSAWIAGWYGYDFQWSHAALEYVNAYTMKPGPVLHVPDPYTPGNFSVGPDGKVWMFDPWTKCNGVSCLGPRFIGYDPMTHRFATFVVPRSVWPHGWRPNNYKHSQDFSKVGVAPDGSVWAGFAVFGSTLPSRCDHGRYLAHVCGVRLFELRNGTIRTHWFPLLTMSSLPPTEAPLTLDSFGKPWLCSLKGTPEVVNAATWAVRPIAVRGGTLTEDQHRNVWYVIKKRSGFYGGC